MRTLLVINAAIDPDITRQIAEDRQPRKDYLELQRSLGADLIDLTSLERQLWTRLLRRVVGPTLAQTLLAARRCGAYDVLFVDRESVGFMLAALLHLRRRRPTLTMIAHLLSSTQKQAFFRFFRLRRTIDRLIVHSSVQQHIAEQVLGMPSERVSLVPYQTDQRFWRPLPQPTRALICSAGLEYRDYDTLVAAVEGLEADVVIAAASNWSTHKGFPAGRQLPAQVKVDSLDYAGLRRLYAESLFVVVPLMDVENQAGITTILEAMAMGKAVVVSHTRGQIDVVRDRRHRNRSVPERPTQPAWAAALGAADETARGHTGIYVRPGDADELRRAIHFLLTHPEQAQDMGRNGRRLLEETMSLDHFTERIAALLNGEATLYQDPAAPAISAVQ